MPTNWSIIVQHLAVNEAYLRDFITNITWPPWPLAPSGVL